MKNLYSAKEKVTYTIGEIPEFNLLKTLGIFQGSKIFKKRTYKLGGPVMITVNERDVAIGKDIALQIQLKELEGCSNE